MLKPFHLIFFLFFEIVTLFVSLQFIGSQQDKRNRTFRKSHTAEEAVWSSGWLQETGDRCADELSECRCGESRAPQQGTGAEIRVSDKDTLCHLAS